MPMRIGLRTALNKIVREQRAIFGELPEFEAPYTFIADFLPHAASDRDGAPQQHDPDGPGVAAERRRRLDMLSTAAHEFFHSWNIERIRPRSLEPFKLDAPNPSGELWFGEGFTNYYEQLTMQRAGLWSVERLASRLGDKRWTS